MDARMQHIDFVGRNMADDAFANTPEYYGRKSGARAFGSSALRVFAALETSGPLSINELVEASGKGRTTVSTIVRRASADMLAQGHEPILIVAKSGRKKIVALADDWKARLDSIRPMLKTDGLNRDRSESYGKEFPAI